jgi:hypothetical protein
LERNEIKVEKVSMAKINNTANKDGHDGKVEEGRLKLNKDRAITRT